MNDIEKAIRNRNDGFNIIKLWELDSSLKFPLNDSQNAYYAAVEKITSDNMKADYKMLLCFYRDDSMVIDWFPLGIDEYISHVNTLAEFYKLDKDDISRYQLQAKLLGF